MTSIVSTKGGDVEKKLASPNVSVASILAARQDARKPVAVEVAPPEPTRLATTGRILEALTDLTWLPSLDFPAERRQLTTKEVNDFAAALDAVKVAEGFLKQARDAVRTAVFTHLDIEVEHSGAEVPVDSKGKHYLAEGSLDVPRDGEKAKFVRQLSVGAPTLTAENLAQLVREGKLSQRNYLKVTKARTGREVDERALLDLLSRREGLVETVADVATPGNTTASLYLR